MIPDVFNQAITEPRQLGLFLPILGVIIVFLGMNMSIEIKIEKKEEEDD